MGWSRERPSSWHSFAIMFFRWVFLSSDPDPADSSSVDMTDFFPSFPAYNFRFIFKVVVSTPFTTRSESRFG